MAPIICRIYALGTTYMTQTHILDNDLLQHFVTSMKKKKVEFGLCYLHFDCVFKLLD